MFNNLIKCFRKINFLILVVLITKSCGGNSSEINYSNKILPLNPPNDSHTLFKEGGKPNKDKSSSLASNNPSTLFFDENNPNEAKKAIYESIFKKGKLLSDFLKEDKNTILSPTILSEIMDLERAFFSTNKETMKSLHGLLSFARPIKIPLWEDYKKGNYRFSDNKINEEQREEELKMIIGEANSILGAFPGLDKAKNFEEYFNYANS